MSLRAATPADVAAVAQLEAALFGADAWSLATVTTELAGPGRFVLVATADGVGDAARAPVGRDALVGYAVATTSGEVADLHRIAVRPSHRRRGVARALLAEVAARSRRGGADRMLLEVSARNAGAVAFYAGQGFTEVDRRRRYYRDGSDALVLGLPLTGPTSGGERMWA